MSSVLHPVGPEPRQTYWVRRAAVISAAILVLAIVTALILNGTSSGSAVQADPSPPAGTPVLASTPTPSVTPAGKQSPTATSTAARKPSAKPTARPKPTTTATETRAPGPVACPAAELRPTLTGKQRLKIRADNKFRLSLINGSGQTCVAEVSDTNFELKIYSGTDRIWSTKDCSKAVKTTKKKLGAEQAVEWSLTWNGRRSRADCKNRSEIPQPGTYFATAQLEGAKPVQLRMILVG